MRLFKSAVNTIATYFVLGFFTFVFWFDNFLDELALVFVASVFLLVHGLGWLNTKFRRTNA